MEELKRNKVFELLGAVPTNARWSWCAVSPDHKIAVFTLWEDEMTHSRYRLSWNDYLTKSRNGETDQKRILNLVMEEDIPAYGLICVARDPHASPRSIKEVRPDYLMKLKITKDSDGVWGQHKGRILMAELVKNVSRLKHLHSNGLVDLSSPPQGNEYPDRALSVGFSVTRDEKVREYVIKRANGCCEYCDQEGFLMQNGCRYLEAHHIISLAVQGHDTVENVIALCPDHHRQAHYAADSEMLELRFIEIVQDKQNKKRHNKA